MRSLTDPCDFTDEETWRLLLLAERISQNMTAYEKVAAHKKLAALFYERSTRTRICFESAMMNLGGKVIGFPSSDVSSASKGETVADTARVVSCYADIMDLCQYLGHRKLNAFLPNYIRENVFQADKASSSTC